jgi:hypothetical protein
MLIQPGRACLYCVDGPGRAAYARRMPEPFASRERWFDVSLPEFEAFLRDYPRPLEARPPLHQQANYREWVDPALGKWPGNAVGKSWKRGGCLGYQIRLDLVLKVSAQERRSCLWCD